jgi:metal-responsive CopG/Arc/MetJ family transcriptional regulator
MRIPEALLKGCGRIAKRKERSRSWIINDYIRQGLTRDGETVPQPTAGALD